MPSQTGGWLDQQREAAEVERDNIANLFAFSQSGEEALAAEIERTGAAHLKWRAAQSRILEGLRKRIFAREGEALLGACRFRRCQLRMTMEYFRETYRETIELPSWTEI